MKLKMFAAALAATTLAGSAFAADLPSRKVAPAYVAPAPVFTWTGFYLGLNAGYAWNSSSYSANVLPGTHLGVPANLLVTSAAGTGSGSRNGFTGGGQIGFNYQISAFVLGLEADIGVAPRGRTLNGFGILTTGNPFVFNQTNGGDLFGTVRGRLGFALDNILIYGTGGLAYRSGSYSWTYADTLANAVGGASVGSKLGWTAGAGVEYAFSPNWSAKLEYLHADFGTLQTTGLMVSTTGGTNIVSTSSKSKIDLVRVGLNYRFGFGGAGPVVAKY